MWRSVGRPAALLRGSGSGPSSLFSPVFTPIRQMAIQMKSRLKVIDNSGAKEVECIDFYKKTNSHYGKKARVGDAIRVVVKKAAHDGRVSKKDIVGAVVARQRAVQLRADGSTVRFQDKFVCWVLNPGLHQLPLLISGSRPTLCSACVLMKRDLSGPIGTRATAPVTRELRENRFMKIVMMASRVL